MSAESRCTYKQTRLIENTFSSCMDMKASGDFFGFDRPWESLFENDVIPDVPEAVVKAVPVLFSLLPSMALGARVLELQMLFPVNQYVELYNSQLIK